MHLEMTEKGHAHAQGLLPADCPPLSVADTLEVLLCWGAMQSERWTQARFNAEITRIYERVKGQDNGD